jgi:hypothetical protein
MNINVRRGISKNILSTLGLIKPVDKQKQVHSVCCDTKMEVDGGNLVCIKCGEIRKNLGEYANKPESQKSQFNSRGAIQPGVNSEKTVEEKNAVLFREFSQKIIANSESFDMFIMSEAVDLYRRISIGNIKKCDNRSQLFAACYYHASITQGNIALEKDIIKLFNLRTGGISEGLNMFANQILEKKISYDVSPIIHPLIIQYFLKKIVINGNCYLTDQNEEFCCKIIMCMIEKNISYDTEMLANCAGVVFYMLFLKGVTSNIKKKTLTQMMTLKQNIYNTTYKLLIRPEVNALLPVECQLSK